MKRLFSGAKMWVLDFLARIRQHIPIQSTWKFVAACALVGAIILGFLGWIADRESQAKLRQNAPAQSVPPTVQQKAEDSNCSNVIAGKDANVNCSSEEVKGNAKRTTSKSP